MKLGTKITLGFSGLIAIALVLGSLSVWNMWTVKHDATLLATETVPAVGIANEVERDSLETMYEMRGYAFTEEEKYLTSMHKALEEVKKDLKEAKERSATGQTLAALKAAAERAEAKVAEYEKLANETVAKTQAMDKSRETMNQAAQIYMKDCSAYLEGQRNKFEKEIKEFCSGTGAIKDKADIEKHMAERLTKMTLVHDVVNLANAARVGDWRAQAERDPKLYQETMKIFAEISQKLATLRPTTTQADDLKRIDECDAAGKAYHAAMSDFLTNWLAREELGRQRGEIADKVLQEAKATALEGMKDTTTATEKAASSLATASTVMLIGLGAALVLGIVLAFTITRSITRPVIRIAGTLTAGAEQTSSAANQVSSSSQSLAQGATEQAAALEETTSALEEMSSMTKKNADTAQQAAALSGEAHKAATRGNEAMGKMSTAITEIQKSASETAKIIKVIDEIAFQTNLLALNAAVEAARAGEAGKGFAVVAEEVRNLAMRSAEAAKNTSAMIEESVNAAKNGVSISTEVAKMLEEITGAATKVNALVAEIAAASQEQSQGIDQVNKAVGQMDKVTQANAASAEESAAAAEELSSQAEQVAIVVQELTSLVNGAKAAAQRTERHAKPTHAAKPQGAPRPAAAPTVAQRMIPLEGDSHGKDADFSEFSKAA